MYNHIMNIFHKIKDSIYNPEYYKSILQKDTLGESIKYLAKLSLIVSIVTTIIIVFFIPKIQNGIREITNTIIENYPSELIVSFKDGTASINQPEPYKIPIGQVFSNETLNKEILAQNQLKENVIVIDTKTPFSLEKFKEYSTSIWLTKTELITLKDINGQIQINPISTLGNIELSKNWLVEKQTYFFKILPIIIPVVVVLIYLILFLFNFIGTLFSLILYAFVIWLISKITKHELTYKQSYILGVYAVTLILLTDAIAMPLSMPNNIFIKLVILILVVYINFFKENKKTISSPSSDL